MSGLLELIVDMCDNILVTDNYNKKKKGLFYAEHLILGLQIYFILSFAGREHHNERE